MIELTMEQGTIAWHEARSGIVTSTKLKSALGKDSVQETLMYELIADRMAEQSYDNYTSRHMDHGNESEPLARQAASKALNLNFEPTGMLMSTLIKGAGMSPDGVSRKNDKIEGGIEIKCPNSKKHIQYIVEQQIPSEYWEQFLTPFVLSDDIKWWVFMSYDYRNYLTPEFYIFVHRVDILKEISDARYKLSNFIEMVDDKYMEICLGDLNKVPETGMPKAECKTCHEKLSESDVLIWGDICEPCKLGTK